MRQWMCLVYLVLRHCSHSAAAIRSAPSARAQQQAGPSEGRSRARPRSANLLMGRGDRAYLSPPSTRPSHTLDACESYRLYAWSGRPSPALGLFLLTGACHGSRPGRRSTHGRGSRMTVARCPRPAHWPLFSFSILFPFLFLLLLTPRCPALL